MTVDNNAASPGERVSLGALPDFLSGILKRITAGFAVQVIETVRYVRIGEVELGEDPVYDELTAWFWTQPQRLLHSAYWRPAPEEERSHWPDSRLVYTFSSFFSVDENLQRFRTFVEETESLRSQNLMAKPSQPYRAVILLDSNVQSRRQIATTLELAGHNVDLVSTAAELTDVSNDPGRIACLYFRPISFQDSAEKIRIISKLTALAPSHSVVIAGTDHFGVNPSTLVSEAAERAELRQAIRNAVGTSESTVESAMAHAAEPMQMIAEQHKISEAGLQETASAEG